MFERTPKTREPVRTAGWIRRDAVVVVAILAAGLVSGTIR